MKSPINSRKHIVQDTQTVVTSATVNTQVLVRGKQLQFVDSAFEVVEGAVVKAVYLERWIGSNTGIEPAGSVVMILEKAPAGVANPTFTEMTTLDAYANKKNILYTTQGIVASNTGNPIPFARQWFKIPKGKQRMGLEDEIRVTIAAIGTEDLSFCGMAVYKSYN